MLFFGLQVIAVILAVFLHHGNGRVITSTNNDNIGTMLDLAEEELNTVLNETSENPTEREENPADVLRLSEPDSPSHEAEQFQFSDDVSDNVILAMEANDNWSQNRRPLDDELKCRTGRYITKYLEHAGMIKYPECKRVAQFTACSSSISVYGKRKCIPSNYKHYPKDNAKYPTTCSCAV